MRLVILTTRSACIGFYLTIIDMNARLRSNDKRRGDRGRARRRTDGQMQTRRSGVGEVVIEKKTSSVRQDKKNKNCGQSSSVRQEKKDKNCKRGTDCRDNPLEYSSFEADMLHKNGEENGESDVKEIEAELNRWKLKYNECKERISREARLVNQLTRTIEDREEEISKLQETNRALSSRLKTAEEVVRSPLKRKKQE